MKTLYFVTVNDYKLTEAKEYLKGTSIRLEPVKFEIQEILHLNLDDIVRDKCIKAYQKIRLPCVVEHGGLYIKALHELPGGLSKVVWDNLKGQLCKLIPEGQSRSAEARSVIGYCDGKRIRLYTGATKGKVAEAARGDYIFQWDPIFIPTGETRTYAELGLSGKAKYSQAAKGWRELSRSIDSTESLDPKDKTNHVVRAST